LADIFFFFAVLVFPSLFHDAVSNSDYISSKNCM